MGMPGPAELLIVFVIGLLVIGVPVAILVFVIIMAVRQRGTNDADQAASKLIEENQALREEIADLKARHN